MTLLFARFLSFLANPITLSFPVSSLAVWQDTHSARETLEWTFLSWIFLILIPLFIFWGAKKGIFKDIELSKREERPVFYLFVGIIGIIYFSTLIFLHGPKTLLVILAGGAVGLFLFFWVNTHIKASLHVFTVSVAAIVLGLIYGVWGIFGLMLVPLTAWARIKTRHHTLPETIVGAILGIIVALSIISLRKYF